MRYLIILLVAASAALTGCAKSEPEYCGVVAEARIIEDGGRWGAVYEVTTTEGWVYRVGTRDRPVGIGSALWRVKKDGAYYYYCQPLSLQEEGG